VLSFERQVKNYIYIKMLHGALLYPGVPDELLVASLHTIKQVKWEVAIPTLNSQFFGVPEELIPEQCNMVAILDPDFTHYGFLSGLVRKGCHLFLPGEQRMLSDERMKLIQLAEEGNTFIQIRNDLLFYPSFLENEKRGSGSKLIEIHHIAPDKPGALQEMLYSNLLMILRIVDSDPSRISVCSIPNSGYLPTVVNLHLNFHNGSAASLTLSFNGDKKEHLFSIHAPGGVVNYNFEEDDHYPSAFNPGFENTLLFSNDLLIKQINYFAECILKKGCQRFGLNDEAKTFRLIEKIYQKLELSSVML